MTQQLIGSTYSDPPFHYGGGEEWLITFRTDRDVLDKVLPPMLKPLGSRNLAIARASRSTRSHFGPYSAAYLCVPALFEDRPVVHMVTGMKSSFSGTLGGREGLGMPIQTGDIEIVWEADTMNLVAGRNGRDFMRMSMRLQRGLKPGEAKAPPLATYTARRAFYDDNPARNLLVAVDKEQQAKDAASAGVDPPSKQYWEASASLQLVGGVPGDDWSIFPVHEVVKATYSTRLGLSTLDGAKVLAEW